MLGQYFTTELHHQHLQLIFTLVYQDLNSGLCSYYAGALQLQHKFLKYIKYIILELIPSIIPLYPSQLI
jgi:hypothetical protein